MKANSCLNNDGVHEEHSSQTAKFLNSMESSISPLCAPDGLHKAGEQTKRNTQ